MDCINPSLLQYKLQGVCDIGLYLWHHKLAYSTFYRSIYCDCTDSACFGHDSHFFNIKSVSNRFLGDKWYLVSPMVLFLFFYLFILDNIKSGLNRCFIIPCSGLLPLNWLTLISSIHICIILVDHAIHGYGHFQRFSKCYIWIWYHMYCLQHPGYCYQLYHWSKLLKYYFKFPSQRLTTHIICHCFNYKQVQL